MQFRFVDLFCGGGGSVSGAIDALHTAGMKYEGRCFNHWDVAVRTIQANHPELIPDFDRACAPVESVLPDEIFASDPMRLDVLWASPSCTHHSVAAGGKPRSNQLRCQPEYLLPYLRMTRCRRMFVENVPELLSWGPLLDEDITWQGKRYKAGQADPRKKGLFFNLWLKEIKASGYRVDYQILNAADYGAATSRRRLIVQAVRKSTGEKMAWPVATHAAMPGIFGEQPWRTAASVIDWTIPGQSIFDRAHPLCANTMRRIEAGIKKYWGAWAEPFLVSMRGTQDAQLEASAIPLTAPLPTITGGRGHIMLIRPFFTQYNGGPVEQHIPSIDDPVPTITSYAQKYALIQPFLTRYNGGENRNSSAGQPMPVIDCSNRYGVIEPMIVPYKYSNQAKGVSQPLDVLTTINNFSLVQPLFIPQHECGTVKPTDQPLSTIATSGAIGLTTPFLTEYYTNGKPIGVDQPIPTISTKDRFGVVQGRILTLPDGRRYQLDITHRMLTTRELADATGFSHDYVFSGTDTDAKKQIGNAVPPPLARALYLAALAA